METKMTRVPQLSWLLAFKSVVEHASFTHAARDLSLTQSAVSQRIAKLEDLMRTQLFFRNSKRVELTDAGRMLLDQIQSPFDEILDVLESYNQGLASKSLVIETEPVWNRVILSPELPRFLSRHKDIIFRQTLTTHHLDFSVGTELAIKWGEGVWPGFDAQYLSGLDYYPVCSPAYMQQNNLSSIEDLARVQILHERDYSDWRFWLKYHPCKGINLNGGHIVGESNILMQLAISGVGVALCGITLVREYLDSGLLVLPFPELKVRHHKAYYILTRKNHKLSEQARMFTDFVNDFTLNKSG
ncbi:LysR family transcriptional regulator [Klebsiella huaxiensis]|uniref:Glycine cleavage system transcriptional activator n=1 Tax=Klebsiella huaxiensis TaxID=2153354 RepID=A0A564HET7_9ENTR|nr:MULTISPECIES: LysR substrate-binding domain-containing protein [Klebsiella]MDG1642551.1 LysR substrate-binding domain-containing protein [Klebsiella huaxiensis]QBG08934.1 LysR family transcriptional regulator [Klebsiella huaxiensis]VUS31031.1 Glycine cleavage system transcriptional activator [Klebsiella huaxiensis]